MTLLRLLKNTGNEVDSAPSSESDLVLLLCFPPNREPVRVAMGTGRVATMTHAKPQVRLTGRKAWLSRSLLTWNRDSTLSPVMDHSWRVVRGQKLQIE